MSNVPSGLPLKWLIVGCSLVAAVAVASCSSPGSSGASGGGSGGGAPACAGTGGGSVFHTSTVVEVGQATRLVLDATCQRDPGPLNAHLTKSGGDGGEYPSQVVALGSRYYAEFIADAPGTFEARPTYGEFRGGRALVTAAVGLADAGSPLEVPGDARCVRAAVLTRGAVVCRFPDHDGLGVYSHRQLVQRLPGVESFAVAGSVIWSAGDAGLERWVDVDGGALERTTSTPASVDLRLEILPNGDVLGVEPSTLRRFALDAGAVTELASATWVGGALVPFAITPNGRWLMQANDAGVCFGPIPLGGADGAPRCPPLADPGETTADLGHLWPMNCAAGSFIALDEGDGGEPSFSYGSPGYLEAWQGMAAPPLANRSPFPGPSFARSPGNHTVVHPCQTGFPNLGPSLTHVTPTPYQGRIELASYGNLSDDVEVITTRDSVLIRPYDGGVMRIAPR